MRVAEWIPSRHFVAAQKVNYVQVHRHNTVWSGVMIRFYQFISSVSWKQKATRARSFVLLLTNTPRNTEKNADAASNYSSWLSSCRSETLVTSCVTQWRLSCEFIELLQVVETRKQIFAFYTVDIIFHTLLFWKRRKPTRCDAEAENLQGRFLTTVREFGGRLQRGGRGGGELCRGI